MSEHHPPTDGLGDDDDGPEDPGMAILLRIAVVGGASAVVLALAVGLVGGSGAGGLGVFLLVCALTAAVVGLAGVALGLRDEARGAHVSRARLVLTVSAFAGATLFMAMVVGVLG